MTDNDSSQDHATPSLGEPLSLIPWARRLYEQGKTREQVMREIYGVDFPAEIYLLRNADGLPLEWFKQPWEIMTPLEQGGPKNIASPYEDLINVHAQAPHVALLMELDEGDAVHGGSIVGYDLDELRAGRSTVVGFFEDTMVDLEDTSAPKSGVEFQVFGPSLLEVIHEWLTDKERLMATQGYYGELYQEIRIIEGLQAELQRSIS